MTVNADIDTTNHDSEMTEGYGRPTVFKDASTLGCFLLDDVGLILAFVEDFDRLPAFWAGRLERRLAVHLSVLRVMGLNGRLTAAEAAIIELIPNFTWTGIMTSTADQHSQAVLDEEIAQTDAEMAELAEECTNDHVHKTL